MQHVIYFFCHAGYVNQWLKGWLIAYHDNDFRCTHSIVTNPFYFSNYIQDADNGTQVTGHRLLRSNELDAILFYLKPLLVYLLVISENLKGRFEVSVLKCLNGMTDGLRHHAPHGENVFLNFS